MRSFELTGCLHDCNDFQGCAVSSCKDKAPGWWIVSTLLLVTWVFLFLLELFGPGINSSKVLINMGTTNGILPSIGAGMTEGLDTTVEAWLDPWMEDPANATYCNHWSDCDCSQECWPIPPEITPSGHHAGICLCKSGSLMEGDSCDIASDPAAVRARKK